MQKKLSPEELELYIVRRDIYRWCEKHETKIGSDYLVNGCRVSKREDEFVVVDVTGKLTGGRYVVVEDIDKLKGFLDVLMSQCADVPMKKKK